MPKLKKLQVTKLQNLCFGRCNFGNWLLFVIWCLALWSFPQEGFCDWLRLKNPEKGSEIEIIEEHKDSFVVKIPKEEIELITRKRPTQMKLWSEKKILWEDTGDYITLYLPKEKIVSPDNYKGSDYDSATALKQELRHTGAEGRPAEISFYKGAGRVLGRILKRGQPLEKVKVKIVSIPSQTNAFARMFTSTKEDKSPELVLEATSDEKGYFEFRKVPLGEYDLYWSIPGKGWYRKLSEKPDVIVKPGETLRYPDIKIN